MTDHELQRYNEMVTELEDKLEYELADYSPKDAYGRYNLALFIAKWATLRVQEEVEQVNSRALAIAQGATE